MRLGFEPCPICGKELDADRNLYFLDIEGAYMTEFYHVHDYENMHDTSNICDDWDELDEVGKKYAKGEYEDAIEGVDTILLHCPCGFSFCVDAERTGFPEPHWLDEMKRLANRRATDGTEECRSDGGAERDPQMHQVRERTRMELPLRLWRCPHLRADSMPCMLMDQGRPVQDHERDPESLECADEGLQKQRPPSPLTGTQQNLFYILLIYTDCFKVGIYLLAGEV